MRAERRPIVVAAALLVAACRTFPPPPAGFQAASFDAIAADPALHAFALAQGALVYDDDCARCHGDDRRGTPGYPDLGDAEWIWGGRAEEIADVVRHGVRQEVGGGWFGGEAEFAQGTKRGDYQEPPVTMIPLDDVLTPAQVDDVADFTERLLRARRDELVAGRGADDYQRACAACHGTGGEGQPRMGFPRLRGFNSQIEARDRRAIARVVRDGTEARSMKAFAGRLSDDEIRCVALFLVESAATAAGGAGR